MHNLVWALIAVTLYVALQRRILPPLITSIPYRRMSRWFPAGDLGLLGIHLFRTREVFAYFAEQCRALDSPIAQLSFPPISTSRPVIVVNDQEAVWFALKQQSKSLDRASIMGTWFDFVVPGASIGKPSNAHFKLQRKLWNCIQSMDFLEQCAIPNYFRSAKRLCKLWAQECAKKAAPISAVQDLQNVVAEANTACFLGVELNLLDSPGERWRALKGRSGREQFLSSFGFLINYLEWALQGSSVRMYALISRHLPAFQRAHQKVDVFLQEIVDSARKRGVKGYQRPTAIDLVLARTQQDERQSLVASDADLKAEALELLLAGLGSTSATFGWMLKYLADNQDVQGKLYEAIQLAESSLGAENKGEDDLLRTKKLYDANIPYLDAVIAETMRCSCVVPVSFRETTQDCEILSYKIPAGTTVILVLQDSGTAYVRDRQFEPQWAFQPERWLDVDGNFDDKSCKTLPFSTGPRMCFGRRFAMAQLRITTISLLQSFHFEPLPAKLSGYKSIDRLTRTPRLCYVKPTLRSKQGL